jgi:hypothetical protein
LTAGLTGGGVVADAARFGLERPMHRMKNCPQSKPNGALRRIQFDLNRGRKSRISGRIRTAAKANQQEGQQSERHKRVVSGQLSVSEERSVHSGIYLQISDCSLLYRLDPKPLYSLQGNRSGAGN